MPAFYWPLALLPPSAGERGQGGRQQGEPLSVNCVAREYDVTVGRGRRVRVRDAGAVDGAPVVFFHGLGDSRLDLRLAEPLAQEMGIRLLSFDRPGYGGSSPAAFTLLSVARDVEVVVDRLGLRFFAVFGQSAGSRFALATAAVLGEGVTRVGCASGSGPVGEVPGSLDDFDDTDRQALALLPQDPAGVAAVYSAAFEPVVELARDADDEALVAAFAPMLAPADRALLEDEPTRVSTVENARESLRQGAHAAGWDSLSWLAPWGFELSDVLNPVTLWYGDQDTTPLSNGVWLRDHLPTAELVIWRGEGHLAYKRHMLEIFSALLDV